MWLDAGEIEMMRHSQKAGGSVFKGLMDMFQRSGARK
jgi:hypothetical protein